MGKNLAKIVDFRKKFARFGEISLDPVRFSPDLAEILLDSVICPQIRHKSNRPDLTPSPVDNDSELPPPDFVGSVSGWAQT